MLTFSSSNPETLELFRSVYYRPKIVLIILLFITFPSIDRNLHQSIQSDDLNLSHKSSYQLHHEQEQSSSSNSLSSQQILISKTTSNPQRTHVSNQDRLHPLSCPDAYLDHRNNIICPHAPKRLKSVRQRFDEVLQEIKTSIKRWSNPQLIHPSSSHLNPQLIKLVTQTSTNGLTKSQNPNWKFRSMICTPTSSPFAHLIILLHTLFFIQALSLLIEDALIKDACSSTFIHSFRTSSSWSKLWSRVKFRFRNQWSKRSFWEPFIFWIVSIIIISTIAIETFGETGSWQTGAIWHDLPFRRICQTLNPLDSNHHHHQNSIHPSTSSSDSKMTKVRISIIGLQALKILSFFLDRAPFLKPARSLILIECGVALVCLCQPAQHFLPQKVLPPSIKIPNRILSRITNRPTRSLIEFNPLSENDRFFNNRHRPSAIETLRSRSNSMHADANHRQSPVVVEVETKWVLSVLVEACVCIAAISSYAVVMVHLPYTSYYWFPLILTITYVKVCVERLKNLYRSALHTIRCLESVLSRFSPEINKRGRDWKCSICFEDEERSDESDDSSKSPTLEEINKTSPIKLNHSGHGNGNQRGEKCVSLKCGHLYHAKCLVKWLHYQTFCPICHRSVHTTTTPTTTTSDSSLNGDEPFPRED